MMQEVYIRILNGLKSFDEKRPLLPWLKRVTINTLINHNNKKKLPQTSLDGQWVQGHPGSVPEEFIAAGDSTEDEAIFRETHAVINSLIRELPEQYRLALTLRYREEMSYEQIATALGQPLGTVKNSVFRARSQLRGKMLACNLLEV